MQISVSSTLTVYHDGQFWVGLAEHVEDGRYGAARIVFGAEPSNEEILRFVVSKWAKLSFFCHGPAEASKPAKNPWIGYTKLDSFVRAGRVRRSPWRTQSTPGISPTSSSGR